MKRSVLNATILVLSMSVLVVRALALEPQPFDSRLEVEPDIWRSDATGEATHPQDPIRDSVLHRLPWVSFPNTGKSLYFN
jgi:hypothetical protein